MVSFTLTADNQAAANFISILETTFQRNEGESDAHYFLRWINGLGTKLVNEYNRRQALEAIESVNEIFT